MEKRMIRVHRLGSVTFGVVLVAWGLLFLAHIFLPSLNFMIAFRLWPVILVLLGVEVLLGSRHKTYEVIGEDGKIVEQCKVIYDLAAILLTAGVTIFTMCLAWVDWAYVNEIGYIQF